MFNLKKFIEAVGISLIITIITSFILGFINISSFEWLMIICFFISYVSIGIFAPILNRKTPYSAAFLGVIVVSVINFLFSIYILGFPVFAIPQMVSNHLASSTVATMVTAVIVVAILNRREREAYD